MRNRGTSLANSGNRVHKKDLILNSSERLIKPHEELHKLLPVILYATRIGAMFVVRGKFVPKAFEANEIGGDGESTLGDGGEFTVELEDGGALLWENRSQRSSHTTLAVVEKRTDLARSGSKE